MGQGTGPTSCSSSRSFILFCFAFCMWILSCPRTIYWKDCSLPRWIILSPFNSILCLFLHQQDTVTTVPSSRFWKQEVWVHLLCCILASLSPLHFLMHFRIGLSVSAKTGKRKKKKSQLVFDTNCAQSVDDDMEGEY